jgi:antitoxin (DNA-binding transcriptional repressor) of toxin-antitoxin stability system
METINIADAKSRFSELVSRTSAGERFMIRRRERAVAVLINPAELDRLERAMRAARRLALALGQDEELIERIEHGEIHPAMAAFGLWRNESDLENLDEEITAERERVSSRPEIVL